MLISVIDDGVGLGDSEVGEEAEAEVTTLGDVPEPEACALTEPKECDSRTTSEKSDRMRTADAEQ